ncbi:Non-structural maintenance of chromosomes element [Rhynchospora pubera]|uniref:Non-structural maintenance of chromosomes element 1 homolog n=1 Tax=Rhynchospora pubera TaxID=906938 RepID=A0AAV8EG77_9POAL|nr:Non-structural maintenance of chromosomes element [Rhynchospora pubera]
MAGLTWRYHTLIQALLSRGPLKEEEFHEVFIGVSGKNPVKHQNVFNEALLRINNALAYVQFELRACRNQYDGKVYYGVVNNVADEQSKLGTKYSAPQIAFYKGVIDAIINDAGLEGAISNIDALNVRLENQIVLSQVPQDSTAKLPTAFKLFNMSQKEKTLQELIKDRWLCQTSSDKIGLGIRSFFDLRGWFRTNEVPSCDVCNEAGVKASICPKEGCSVRIHDYCLKKKFSKRTGARACSGCGTEWPLPEYESEEIDENNTTSPDESQIASANPVLRDLRKAKTEKFDSSQDASQRKKRRICKPEPAETVEAPRRGRSRARKA